MRIVDLLSKDSILLNASPKNKAEAIVKCSPFVRQCGIIEIYQ